MQDGGADELERLVKEEGFSAVRFNPYLWPEGEKMTNARGRKMYQRAGALGVPVGHMPFKGLLRHIDEIEALLREYPETKAIIDHMVRLSIAMCRLQATLPTGVCTVPILELHVVIRNCTLLLPTSGA